MFKKLIALTLLVSLSSFTAPLNAATAAVSTLQDFLSTTDNIDASFAYPNYIASTNNGSKKVLAAHSPVVIRATDAITTKDIVEGDTVNFTVVSDVRDSAGNILVKSGSPVSATINFKKNGMIGRSGELTITDFHVLAVDGTYIPLSSSITAKPDDKMVLSIVLSVLVCPLFLLIKGDEAKMPAGTTKTVYTVTETYINATKL